MYLLLHPTHEQTKHQKTLINSNLNTQDANIIKTFDELQNLHKTVFIIQKPDWQENNKRFDNRKRK